LRHKHLCSRAAQWLLRLLPGTLKKERAGVQPRVFQECLFCSLNQRTYDFFFLASK
jgi:hypothetical protein